jgi:hypothetical protein
VEERDLALEFVFKILPDAITVGVTGRAQRFPLVSTEPDYFNVF